MDSNVQNKLKNKIKTDSDIENSLTAVREEGRWKLGEKSEGTKQKSHRHRQ